MKSLSRSLWVGVGAACLWSTGCVAEGGPEEVEPDLGQAEAGTDQESEGGAANVDGEAAATDVFELRHTPPSEARAGQDLVLDATVTTSCNALCKSVYVYVYYTVKEGKDVIQRYQYEVAPARVGGTVPPANYVQVTIPASDVTGDAFDYYVVARQYRSSFLKGEPLNFGYARSPEAGEHSVPLTP